MSMEQQLREAMARGYCTPENSSKEMDSVLIDAMIKEILISVGFMPKDESRLVETEVSQKNAEGLLPCPFCGYEAEIRIRGTQHNSMIIACTHCGGKIESGDVYGLTKPEHYHWNKRI